MAASLTAGAIAKMLNGEVETHKEMMPILQVTEMKLICHARKNQESMERYKVSLSDGIQSQEGMLHTTLNILVKQGKIQIGSVLRLTHFFSNQIQIRRIVIVMELEIIAEQCNIIGNPLPAHPGKPTTPGQTSTDQTQQQQSRVGSVNTQSIGGFEQQQGRMSELNGAVRHGVANSAQHQVSQRRALGTGSEFPETKPSVIPFVSSNAGYGISMHNVANSPQPQVGEKRAFGTASGFHETSPSVRPFVSSNTGYGSSRQELSRAPPSAYSRPPVQPQPPSMYANMGPVARNEAPLSIFPIAALNPYQGRWTIKVRVTSKGELRRFNSTRGEGKVFSFDLVDAAGGEIRVTCFNDVVDKFFDMIVAGNVYLITKGNLKPARKEYNHLPNDYEIHLDNGSTIQQCYEDDATIPRNQFHFRDIVAIESMEGNSIIDVIGIVSSISPTGSILRKNGTEAQKRALQLKDMSGRSVEVTMWGNFCNAEGQRLQSLCDSGVFPVLAVKAGRISEFNGKQVSTIGSSQLVVEPDLPEARELRAWYDREGRNAPCISISRQTGAGRQEVRKVITQIKDENLGTSEKPDWITVSATISFVKVENFCYTACPNMNGDRPCSKKVTNNGDGTWRCEKCDICVDECDYRYILQLQLQDHTGVTWATAFQEAGEEIMGIPAKDLYYMKNEDRDEEKFEEIVRKAAFTKYIFKLKVKEETFSDESRVKATVVKAERLDYSSDTRSLLEAMNKLRAEDANPESSNFMSGAFNSGIGTTGTRETSSVDVPRREFGLPAANQVNQFGNQHSSDSRPLGGVVTLCDACGSNAHVFANCPSFLSEPQGQHVNSAYGNTQGRNAGGGMPRQHVGGY